MFEDFVIVFAPFVLWGLFDASAVKWREYVWDTPIGYIKEKSELYVRWLLITIYSAMIINLLLFDKLYLIIPFIIMQQCGVEDFIYLVFSKFFGKNWDFAENGHFLGWQYPKFWPWLSGMPLLRFFGGSNVSIKGLLLANAASISLATIIISL